MLARFRRAASSGEDLARLDRKRKGKKLSNRTGSRPRGQAFAKMKDGTPSGLQPEHAVDAGHRAVVAAELHPADRGHTTTLEKTLAAAKENLEAVLIGTDGRRPGRICDRQGLSLTVGLKGACPWKTRISEPKQKGFRWHGDGVSPLQSPTTGPGCYRAWPRKPSSCAPRSSSAPLRTTSIAAACAGHGCRSPCTSEPAPVAGHNRSLLAQTDRRRHPAMRPWRADMAVRLR